MIEDKDPNVYDKNDYTPRLRLEKDDDNTGLPVPASGIVDLDVWIAAHNPATGLPQPTPIDASLKVRAAELSKVPGTYRITINGSDIHTHMFAGVNDYDEEDVWIMAENVGGNISGAQRVKALRIRRMSNGR